MKLVIVPGFLGFAEEPHHIDLIERSKEVGVDGIVVESEELSHLNLDNYLLSRHLDKVNNILDNYIAEQVVLIGVSLGGVVATMASLGRENVVKLACIVSPYQFANGDDMEPKLDEWRIQGSFTFTSSKYGQLDVPYNFVEDACRFDARDVISEVKCPKLFLAGSLDVRVPPNLTLELSDKATQPKTFKIIDGMRHDYKNQPEFTKLVNDNLLDFMFI